MSPMVLTGDENTPALPLTEAQVNHLRRLLAWMRCEYMLDEDMQRGYLSGLTACAQAGIGTDERRNEVLAERIAKVNHVPIYLRQGIKMLTKAVRDHEKRSGIVDAAKESNQEGP